MLDATEAQRDPTYVVGAAVDGFDEFVGCAGVEVLRPQLHPPPFRVGGLNPYRRHHRHEVFLPRLPEGQAIVATRFFVCSIRA